jgi:hypothetical protein
MEINWTEATASARGKRRIAPLTVVLAAVFVVFCGILIFVYAATKRANPVMLDQQGRPLDQQSAPATPAMK